MYDLVVRGGMLVTPAGRVEADLAISNGKVAAIGLALGPAAEEVDASGLYVLPGLVDPHVHFRDPGLTQKEDFGSGTLAAAFGGVTTVLDMPNTMPAVATARDLLAKREVTEGKAHVDYGLFGIILQENEGDLAGMAETGAIGYKLFMGETTGNNPCPDDGAIFGAFREAARLDLPVAVHAENNPILQRLKRELKAAGRTDPRAHLDSRPAFVEAEAVARAAMIAQGAGNRLHVVHVSSRDGLAQVVAAERRGVRATCEALVAHLLLDDRAYDRYGNLAVLSPPLRTPDHVRALWDGIARGEIDCIGSDHAPHTAEEQARRNVWEAVGGWVGVETTLPLMLAQVAGGRLTLERFVQLASENPARIYGLYPRKGSLQVGADADLVLVDLDRQWTLDQRQLHSKHPVTPFDGWTVAGKLVATFLRGRCIVRDGELVSEPTGAMLSPGVRTDSSALSRYRGYLRDLAGSDLDTLVEETRGER